MKEMILSLFGSYEPVTYTEYFQIASEDGTLVLDSFEVVASGLAGVDWPWVMGVLLFAIVLYSFFRLLGVILK